MSFHRKIFGVAVTDGIIRTNNGNGVDYETTFNGQRLRASHALQEFRRRMAGDPPALVCDAEIPDKGLQTLYYLMTGNDIPEAKAPLSKVEKRALDVQPGFHPGAFFGPSPVEEGQLEQQSGPN